MGKIRGKNKRKLGEAGKTESQREHTKGKRWRHQGTEEG